jgi:hypothetical protein
MRTQKRRPWMAVMNHIRHFLLLLLLLLPLLLLLRHR